MSEKQDPDPGALKDMLDSEGPDLDEEEAEEAFVAGFGGDGQEPEPTAGDSRAAAAAEASDQALADSLAGKAQDVEADMSALGGQPEETPEDQDPPDQGDPEAQAQDEATDQAAEGSQGAQEGGSPDPAPETSALEKTIQELQERLRRQEGLAGHLNAQLRDLRQQAQQPPPAPEPGAGQPPAGRTPTDIESGIAEAIANQEEFQALAEEFPEIAKGLKAGILSAIQSMPSLAGGSTPFDLQEITDQVYQQVKADFDDEQISEKHPGWTEKINTPLFGAWIEAQPADTQALAQSVRYTDAIALLDQYAEFENFVVGLGDRASAYTAGGLLDLWRRNAVDSEADADQRSQAGGTGSSTDRLARHVPATNPGGGTRREQPASAEDAFLAGFKSQR